jgi:hypothetical protein
VEESRVMKSVKRRAIIGVIEDLRSAVQRDKSLEEGIRDGITNCVGIREAIEVWELCPGDDPCPVKSPTLDSLGENFVTPSTTPKNSLTPPPFPLDACYPKPEYEIPEGYGF